MSLFQERIKELRESSEKTQVQIAEDLGITPQALSYYINGREPSYDLLIKMANLFNVSTDYLLGRSELKSINESLLTKEFTDNFIKLRSEIKGPFPDLIEHSISFTLKMLINYMKNDYQSIPYVLGILKSLNKISDIHIQTLERFRRDESTMGNLPSNYLMEYIEDSQREFRESTNCIYNDINHLTMLSISQIYNALDAKNDSNSYADDSTPTESGA